MWLMCDPLCPLCDPHIYVWPLSKCTRRQKEEEEEGGDEIWSKPGSTTLLLCIDYHAPHADDAGNADDADDTPDADVDQH